MTLNELFLDSLEPIDSFYIDYEKHTRQITKEMYEKLENYNVKSYYLDIKDNKPCIIVLIDGLHPIL